MLEWILSATNPADLSANHTLMKNEHSISFLCFNFHGLTIKLWLHHILHNPFYTDFTTTQTFSKLDVTKQCLIELSIGLVNETVWPIHSLYFLQGKCCCQELIMAKCSQQCHFSKGEQTCIIKYSLSNKTHFSNGTHFVKFFLHLLQFQVRLSHRLQMNLLIVKTKQMSFSNAKKHPLINTLKDIICCLTIWWQIHQMDNHNPWVHDMADFTLVL